MCLTLAGAQLGLEVCFNWGRGQRRGDAPTSSVRLFRSLIQRRWRFSIPPSQTQAGGSGKTIPGKGTPKKFCEAAAAAPAAPA